MTNLLDLPTEVLQEICKALSPTHIHGSLQHIENMRFNRVLISALSGLSQTCWTFRNLAQPMLYYCPLTAGSGFISLVRTLCERPDLAQMVRVLRVNGPWHLKRGHVISANDVAFFNIALSKCRGVDGQPIQVSQNWHLTVRPQPLIHSETELFQYDPRMALSALALAQITNVLRLEVGAYDDEPLSFMFCRPGSFPRLRELYLEHGAARRGEDLNAVDSLLQAAPALSSLEACRINSASDFIRHDNVVEVTLRNNNLDFGSLQTIMRQFRNLQTFSYRAWNFPMYDLNQATPREISQALLIRADTLRNVSLWFTSEGIPPEHMTETWLMSSLKEMQLLERLEVDGCGLHNSRGRNPTTGDLLTDFLPSSIQSLTIDSIFDKQLSDILNLARKASSCFPSLRDVCLAGLSEENHDTIRVAFEAIGVRTDVKVGSVSRFYYRS